MAVYKIFPTQDSTIYTEDVEMNTGLDEILECSTYMKADGNFYTSRALIQFSEDEINNLIDNEILGKDFKTYLKLYSANVSGLDSTKSIICNPIALEWDMGLGKYKDDPVNTVGVNWNNHSIEQWSTSSISSSLLPYIEENPFYDEDIEGGGIWFTNSPLGLETTSEQTFGFYTDPDLELDVTNTIKTWYSGSLPNYGFILRQDNDEGPVDTKTRLTQFKYFSRDTNTIYPPCLEFRWDDMVFSTGSSENTVLDTTEAFISVYNNLGCYYYESNEKFKIAAFPKYPSRSFSTSSVYTKNYYLPENNSWYAIKDSQTNNFIIDFDEDYTKISADEDSSYFFIDMNGLEPERYYTILIKATIGGVTRIWDDNIFKVVNG